MTTYRSKNVSVNGWVLVGTLALLGPIGMASPTAYAQTKPQGRTVASQDRQLLNAPEEYLTAQSKFDVARLAALTTADFIEISPVGEVDPRAKMLSFYTPDKKIPSPAMRFDRTYASQNGGAGVVIGTISYIFTTPNGQTRTSALTAAFSLRKTGKQWRLVTAQYTPVRPAGKK